MWVNVQELPDDQEYKVWMVWKVDQDRPIIVAITTSEDRAGNYVKMIEMESRMNKIPVPDTYVEVSRLNHLYGQSVTDLKSFKYLKALQKLNLK